MSEALAALAASPGIAIGAALLAALLGTLFWEARRPARRFGEPPAARVGANYGLLLTTQACGVAIIPLAGWVAALVGGSAPPDVGFWPSALLALLVIDATHWGLHWAEHRVAWLWRVHAVHHSDAVYDASVAFRFHPIEAALVAIATAAAAALARLSPEGMLLAVVVTTALNVIQHANAELPAPLERALRLILITPDLHRQHHADTQALAACNYATVLSLWDRMAGTLRVPARGQPVRFGLCDEPAQRFMGVWGLLAAPFRRPVAA